MTITYYANGTTSGAPPVDATVYAEGQTITVLGNTGKMLYANHKFNGWNTAADGSGTAYAVGDTITVALLDIKLYAVWLALNITEPDPVIYFLDKCVYGANLDTRPYYETVSLIVGSAFRFRAQLDYDIRYKQNAYVYVKFDGVDAVYYSANVIDAQKGVVEAVFDSTMNNVSGQGTAWIVVEMESGNMLVTPATNFEIHEAGYVPTLL